MTFTVTTARLGLQLSLLQISGQTEVPAAAVAANAAIADINSETLEAVRFACVGSPWYKNITESLAVCGSVAAAKIMACPDA